MNIVITLHIVTLALSVGMYVINFGLMVKQSPYQDHAGVIKFSRVLDMLAIMMIALVCIVSGKAPFDDAVMTEKMIATLTYAFMVFMALKQGKNIFFRSFAFAGSIGWLFYVYSLAVNGEAYLLR
jgi:uncharacterized membrane protein SirB2